jgi:hypothetical protein
MSVIVSAGIVARHLLGRLLDLRTQNSEGTQLHFSLLRDSFHLMLREPWGIGLGGFARWYQRERRPWEPPQWSTFNSYTDAGASSGVVALVGYLVLLGGLAMCLWRRAMRMTSGSADAAGALVGLIAASVGAFGYNVFAAGYFVGFLGLIAAVASQPDELAVD